MKKKLLLSVLAAGLVLPSVAALAADENTDKKVAEELAKIEAKYAEMAKTKAELDKFKAELEEMVKSGKITAGGLANGGVKVETSEGTLSVEAEDGEVVISKIQDHYGKSEMMDKKPEMMDKKPEMMDKKPEMMAKGEAAKAGDKKLPKTSAAK